jgi:hypothetical protein
VEFVDEACTNVARIPCVWCEPWLNEQDPSRDKVLCHTLEGSGEVIEGFDVSNGAEETGHTVKRMSKVAVCHVCAVQRDTWIPLTSNGKYLLVKIESFDLEMLFEIGEMEPSATGNISDSTGFWGW